MTDQGEMTSWGKGEWDNFSKIWKVQFTTLMPVLQRLWDHAPMSNYLITIQAEGIKVATDL